jgi:hypothetical protein
VPRDLCGTPARRDGHGRRHPAAVVADGQHVARVALSHLEDDSLRSRVGPDVSQRLLRDPEEDARHVRRGRLPQRTADLAVERLVAADPRQVVAQTDDEVLLELEFRAGCIGFMRR